MYKISRIIKGLQFTTRNRVVRFWNDNIVKKQSIENGKKLVEELIYIPVKK